MVSLFGSNKELEVNYREFELELMEASYDFDKFCNMMYLTEKEETDEDNKESKSSSKFLETVHKIIDKICDFIQSINQKIGDLISKDSGLSTEEFLKSKTGEITLDFDLENISNEVDKEVARGNKLVDLISRTGDIDPRIVDEYVNSCARAVDKKGKYVVKAAIAPIMYNKAVNSYDAARALKGKDGIYKQCKSMKGQGQITKILNAMGNMTAKSSTMINMYFNEYNKLASKDNK